MKPQNLWHKVQQTIENNVQSVSQSPIGQKIQQVGEQITSQTIPWLSYSYTQIIDQIKEFDPQTIAHKITQILPEQEIPVYLLPTGCGKKQFICQFDFDNAIQKLDSGILVKPKIKVYGSRKDVDRNYLASILQEQFIQQFEATKQSKTQQNQQNSNSRIEYLQNQQKKLQQKTQESAMGVGGMLVIALTLLYRFYNPGLNQFGFPNAVNPLFHLFFFGTAITSGVDTLKKVINYLFVSHQLKGDENQIKKELQTLEAEFDSKNESFMKAINNLEINIHPVLQKIIIGFYRIEGLAFYPSKTTSNQTLPANFKQFLTSNSYRQLISQNTQHHYQYIKHINQCLI